MNTTIYREPKVFVFCNSETKICTVEENELFFKENLSFELAKNNLNKSNKFDSYCNKLYSLTNKLNNRKFILSKVVPCIALTLYLALNPNKCFALASLEEFKVIGISLANLISDTIIKGVLILCAVKLLIEYSNGANQNRIFDILKECLSIILVVMLLPKIPEVFSLLIK